MIRITAALFLSAAPVLAQEPPVLPDNGGPHFMAQTFAEAPCRMAISTIDTEVPTTNVLGMMAMAFGYLLGYEAGVGQPLRGEHETLLKRLRSDCQANPNTTALEFLDRYAAEVSQ